MFEGVRNVSYAFGPVQKNTLLPTQFLSILVNFSPIIFMVLVQGAVSGNVPGFLRVHDIFISWICQSQDYRYFCWPPTMTSPRNKQPTGHDGDGYNNKVYVQIIDNLRVKVHARRR